jgi:hypothetical protein
VREGGNTEFSSGDEADPRAGGLHRGIEIRLSIRHLRGMDCNLLACLDLYHRDDNLEAAEEPGQTS